MPIRFLLEYHDAFSPEDGMRTTLRALKLLIARTLGERTLGENKILLFLPPESDSNNVTLT